MGFTWGQQVYTMAFHYSMINVFQKYSQRQPISHPHGAGFGVFFFSSKSNVIHVPNLIITVLHGKKGKHWVSCLLEIWNIKVTNWELQRHCHAWQTLKLFISIKDVFLLKFISIGAVDCRSWLIEVMAWHQNKPIHKLKVKNVSNPLLHCWRGLRC